ncbi:cation:dicarboxylase symporter family transporter, partial [Streptomyces sp. MCAF7]
LLQVLVLACLVGAALLHLGKTKVPAILPAIEQAQEVVFAIVGFIMRLAPLAVFGAMAHLVGQYGMGALTTYGKLIALCYGVALLFLAVLGVALKAITGLSLWKFVKYTREEMLLALGTASSETVLPRVMQKLRAAGCRDDAVGLVLPTGYSFNLDGASIYLSIGTLFISQAVGVDLSLGQQITVVLVLMLTSKGMAGVPGSAFLALSATASALGVIPAAAVALLLGVDRIMDSMRVATNLLGNCVAVFAVSRWEGALDMAKAKRVLDGERPVVEEEAAAPAEAAPDADADADAVTEVDMEAAPPAGSPASGH